MRPAFLFFFLSALFYSPVLLAQTDSTFTDTIVIFKDPHIIRHEVVIDSPPELARKIPPLKFGLYYGIGINKINQNEPYLKVSGRNFNNFGIQLGYDFNHFEFGVGVGFLNNSVEYNSLKSFELVKKYREWAEVDRDSIVIRDPISGAITKTIVTILNDSVSRESHEIINYNVKSIYNRHFLQIPLSVGYCFDLPFNFKVTPGLQIIINQLLSENGDPLTAKIYAIKTISPQYGLYLKLEHYLSGHISTELKCFWTQSVGNINKEDHQEKWMLMGLNFAVNYKIGN